MSLNGCLIDYGNIGPGSFPNRYFVIRDVLLAVVMAGTWSATCAAQDARFELGLRLRQFERAFEQLDSPEFRQSTLPYLEQAVQSFFRLRLGEAARSLDRARAVSLPEEARPAFLRAANLAVTPERTLYDSATDRIHLVVSAAYGNADWAGVELSVSWSRLHDRQRQQPSPALGSVAHAFVNGRGESIAIPTVDWDEGDYLLGIDTVVDDQRIRLSERVVSLVNDLTPRLNRLVAARGSTFDGLSRTQKASFDLNVSILEDAAQGSRAETDYPTARLLAQCERALTSFEQGSPFFGAPHTGEFWLRLVGKTWRMPARIYVPEQVNSDHPIPVVLALHGAGGSENMFFDGYGDGKVVRLASERGWLVVSPRVGMGNAPFDELIDVLEELYPIDRESIFVLGHSMGAGAAMGFTNQGQLKPRAVAALGGGGSVDRNGNLGSVQFFVGAGSHDFGRSGAQRLANSLERAQVAVQYRTYSEIEHLVIVQVALDDVFEFFERHHRSGK